MISGAVMNHHRKMTIVNHERIDLNKEPQLRRKINKRNLSLAVVTRFFMAGAVKIYYSPDF
jgi:hypothetical protein